MTSADLIRLRTKLGWSQARLGMELGVTRSTINKWEMGLHPVPRMAEKLLSLMMRKRNEVR